MANTNATESWNAKWFQTNLQETLKAALVAEKICRVDNSDNMYIWNPYGSAPTTIVQAIIGTYVPATYTSTADTLTVAYEFIVSEHIYHFEQVMQHGDIRQSRTDEITASVATAIDKYVNKFTAYYKSSLINGETLIAKAKATLKKAYCHLQRLSERTLLMSEATVRTA